MRLRRKNRSEEQSRLDGLNGLFLLLSFIV